MDIKDILSGLGLDFTDPEAKRGALEAIEAIIASRVPPLGGGGSIDLGGASADVDVELDPDLLQPSKKHNQAAELDQDIEINDEEDVLSQMRRNDDDSEDDPGSSSSSTQNNQNETKDGESEPGDSDSTQDGDVTSTNSEQEPSEQAPGDSDSVTDSSDTDDGSERDVEGTSEEDPESTVEDELKSDGEEESADEDSSESDTEDSSMQGPDEKPSEAEEDEPEEAEVEPDEDDLLDDHLKAVYDDKDLKAKQDARKIKKERTLQAAKKALADAVSRGVSKPLINELEKAIEALETLKEAVEKSIQDLSDEEFNLIINRVFDAISAVGDSSLTFTSEEEREIQAKEIKDDLSKQETQRELSAEDIAKIRAETQAAKAREQENDKYRSRRPDSFKGFQDFLMSLYRAIAVQVHTDETQDDSWSAINRRYSGSGVLQPGKKINELPNKQIPIIDFYFDCSGSWTDKDLAVGEKAVQALVDMEEKGQIKINIYYFSDYVHTDAASARAEGSTGAWNEIVKNIIATKATNVVIMTDSDMQHQCNDANFMSYTVPGCVWYLWRYGVNAPRLPKDLKGRGGTQQFSFSR